MGGDTADDRRCCAEAQKRLGERKNLRDVETWQLQRYGRYSRSCHGYGSRWGRPPGIGISCPLCRFWVPYGDLDGVPLRGDVIDDLFVMSSRSLSSRTVKSAYSAVQRGERAAAVVDSVGSTWCVQCADCDCVVCVKVARAGGMCSECSKPFACFPFSPLQSGGAAVCVCFFPFPPLELDG